MKRAVRMRSERRLKAPNRDRIREKPRVETPIIRASVPNMESLSLQRFMAHQDRLTRGGVYKVLHPLRGLDAKNR